MDELEEIATSAEAESELWRDALLPMHERQLVQIFGSLVSEELRLGVETIYEGYLVHYGSPRLFAPADADVALLLGDYLYAHGLVRVAATGDLDAVAALAELISTCAALRAESAPGDADAWYACARALEPGDTVSRALVERARAAHARLVG